MFAVRFHGRGGQGVATAAELLASAASREGRYAQASASFGQDRPGVPVMSFCRIDNKPIVTHEPVTDPDALLILDPTLLHQADLFAGLKPRGYVLVNAAKGLGLADLAASRGSAQCLTVPASSLAMARLGRPLPAAPMLAALAALSGVVGLDGLLAAIGDRFTGQAGAGNAAAAVAAFDYVLAECGELTGA
jgi:pyruvate ferredoxin oxidoreductase gamma subunit